jgi:hypothetical protein
LPALITERIDQRDSFEIVRDQIASILKLELDHQSLLHGGQCPSRVFVERANPWGDYLETTERQLPPLVNVWFDTASYDGAASNIVERQRCEATYHIDCYGFGVSVDDGDAVGGHVPGDVAAVLEAQKTARFCRKVLMAGAYTYLGLRGLVGKRWPQSLTAFQPQIDNRQAQRVAAMRLALSVHFNELSPQVQGEVIELISVEVYRAQNGELLVRADYPKE